MRIYPLNTMRTLTDFLWVWREGCRAENELEGLGNRAKGHLTVFNHVQLLRCERKRDNYVVFSAVRRSGKWCYLLNNLDTLLLKILIP